MCLIREKNQKLLSLFASTAIIASSASTVVSCDLFAHKVLNMDMSKWKNSTIFMKDMDLMQAMATGKHTVYLNPDANSTPYAKTNGDYVGIKGMWANNFDKNADKNRDPQHTPDEGSGEDQGLYSFQLNYIVDSFLVYYQNVAKKNKNAPLKDLASFRENFDVVYWTASEQSTETYFVYQYLGHDADGNETLSLQDKARSESEYYDTAISKNVNRVPQGMDNIWAKNTQQYNDGGAVTSIYLDGAQQGSNEIAHVTFNFDVVIKPSYDENGNEITKTVTNDAGEEIKTPVSKDGYYSSDPNSVGYWSSSAILMITLPLAI